MKYLAFTATVLSLVGVGCLMVIGIRLDVFIADIIGLYMSTMAVVLLVFVFSLLILVRAAKDAKKDVQPEEGSM